MIASLLSRERGLKLRSPPGWLAAHVAPLAGAWVEITLLHKRNAARVRRSSRGSVG